MLCNKIHCIQNSIAAVTICNVDAILVEKQELSYHWQTTGIARFICKSAASTIIHTLYLS